MTGDLSAAYKSGAQRARVVTEFWGESNLYCPNCSSPKLSRLQNNTKASDYSCPHSRLHLISARQGGFWYQLTMGSAAAPASNNFFRNFRGEGAANHTRGACAPCNRASAIKSRTARSRGARLVPSRSTSAHRDTEDIICDSRPSHPLRVGTTRAPSAILNDETPNFYF